MATTSRFLMQLLDDAQQGKALAVNAALNILDAAAAALGLTNAFTGANSFSNTSTFTGATKHSGAVSGSGTGYPLKSVSVTFPSNADYTLLTAEYECPLITINTTNIAGALNMIFPATAGAFWIVTNNSGFAITCKTSGGTGIAVASNRRAGITGGGVNITRLWADSVTTP